MELGNINVLDLIILLGAVQGFIFSAYLLMKPLANKKASFFLALFIFSFSMNCIYHTLESIGLRGYLNAWDFSPFYCSLLIITAFHFFIHFLMKPQAKIGWKVLIIFMPYVLQFVFQNVCLVLSFVNPLLLRENANLIFEMYHVFDVMTILMGTVVFVLAVIKIKKYESDLRENFAEITEFSLSWLNKLLFFLFGVWMLFAIPAIYEIFTGYSPMSIYYPLWIATSIFIYWIGYSTYSRAKSIGPELVHHNLVESNNTLSTNTGKYHEDLLALMKDKKPYLDQDLNLAKLAYMLGISSGYLSQIINQYEQRNFFEFVNGYRVTEVKKLLSDNSLSHLNLLGIAYEAGFKSKSTFNLAFKKISGMTPTAYKKSL